MDDKNCSEKSEKKDKFSKKKLGIFFNIFFLVLYAICLTVTIYVSGVVSDYSDCIPAVISLTVIIFTCLVVMNVSLKEKK
jgi:hypothetical protein